MTGQRVYEELKTALAIMGILYLGHMAGWLHLITPIAPN